VLQVLKPLSDGCPAAGLKGVCENSALSPLGERVARAGVCTSRRGTGLRPPKGKRRAVNNIGFGPQAGEGVPT